MLKVDFWKCDREDCDYQTTLESEKIAHEQPFISDDNRLVMGHTMTNQRFKEDYDVKL